MRHGLSCGSKFRIVPAWRACFSWLSLVLLQQPVSEGVIVPYLVSAYSSFLCIRHGLELANIERTPKNQNKYPSSRMKDSSWCSCLCPRRSRHTSDVVGIFDSDNGGIDGMIPHSRHGQKPTIIQVMREGVVTHSAERFLGNTTLYLADHDLFAESL